MTIGGINKREAGRLQKNCIRQPLAELIRRYISDSCVTINSEYMKTKLIASLIVCTLVIACTEDSENTSSDTTPVENTVSNDSDSENDSTENSTPQPESPNPPNVLGMDYTQSKTSIDETYSALIASLEANPNIKIVAEIDHMANAASVDKTLNPTKIVFFGNPNLGTPLMQKNQLAGLDLPQKILVYQNENGQVYAGFNNTTYFGNRHGLTGMEVLPTIQGALTNLSTGASNDGLVMAENSEVDIDEGIITKASANSCEDTYMALRAAIENNPNLKIIAELDHAANAASVGLELNPTRLIVFGNPNLGTPLMQNAQTTALDLPQKMLVWTDANNDTYISYNDPAFLVYRHGITENEAVVNTISGALNTLSDVAIGKQ